MEDLHTILRFLRLLSECLFSILMLLLCVLTLFKHIVEIENEKLRVGLATISILLIIAGAVIFLAQL